MDMSDDARSRAIDVQMAALGAAFGEFRRHIDQRLDDLGDVSRDRHADSSARLERIEDQTRKTNGTVARHAQLLETHKDQIDVLFERTHAAAAAMGVPIVAAPPTPAPAKSDEEKSWTRRDAYMISLGAAGLAALYKFIVFVMAAGRVVDAAPK